MKKKVKSYLSVLIAPLIALILLLLAIRNINWAELQFSLTHFQVAILGVLFLVNTITLLLRSFRWGVLLSKLQQVPHQTVFWATAVGYLGNTTLPARAGELIRSILLGHSAGVNASYVFATAIVERLIDALVLALTAALLIFTLSGVPDWVARSMTIMGGLGIIALMLLVLARRFEGFLQKRVANFPIPEIWKTRVSNLISQFILGSQVFLYPSLTIKFLGLTAILWLGDGLGLVILAYGMGLNLSLFQSLFFIAAQGLSSAVPSTPGYIGIYQFVAVTILPSFGMSPSQALSFVLLAQAINVLVVVFYGCLGLWRLNIRPRELLSEIRNKSNISSSHKD